MWSRRFVGSGSSMQGWGPGNIPLATSGNCRVWEKNRQEVAKPEMRQTALLPDNPGPGGTLVPPDLIEADPNQPRREFDPAGIRDLMASIAAVGLIQPLVVIPLEGGRYRLVAGERRLRAIRMGAAEHPDNPHFQAVPVRVRDRPPGDLDRIRTQLDENRVRENLTPGEVAGAYREAKRLLEVREAERYLDAVQAWPEGYDPAAGPEDRHRVLVRAMGRRGAPWPEVPWSDVFAALGQPADRRVIAILRIPDEVLARCDALNLTKSAAAALAELPDRAVQLAVLDVVERAGDPSLVTPVVGQLQADPSLGAEGALRLVLSARQAVRASSARAPNPGDGQAVLALPPCPAEDFDRITSALRDAVALAETHALSEYQAGSLRLLATRLAEAVGSGR